MNQIQDPALTYDFGYDFNFVQWAPNTEATLCNVPWGADYRDVYRGTNRTSIDTYIDGLPSSYRKTFTKLTYIKFGEPVTLGIPYNEALKYNYIRVENPAQYGTSEPLRSYYYFITDVKYISPEASRLMLQLDVWQTFQFDVTFGNCYVERGHIGIAQEDSFDNYGRDYLTIPEGLDTGNEYQIVHVANEKIAQARNTAAQSEYSIIVTSNTSLTLDPGDAENPNLATAGGSFAESLPSASAVYVFDNLESFTAAMGDFQQYSWVTQGIVSVMAIPKMSRYDMTLIDVQTFRGTPFKEWRWGTPVSKNVDMMPANWRETVVDLGRYSRLKKFLTFPYMVLELTTYNGAPVLLKPELWASASCTVNEIPHLVNPSARIVVTPLFYNATAQSVESAIGNNDGGEFLDVMTGIFNFPQFSILNNSYVSYIASSANQIAYQHSSADWSQQKALRGNEMAYNQSTANMNNAQALTQIGVGATNQRAALSNNMSALGGLVNVAKALPIGPVGVAATALNNAANVGMSVHSTNQSASISNDTAHASTDTNVGNSEYMRDTNRAYADYATQGDYENTIAGINARVQDAKMIQPTTSGQVGGDAFNLAMYRWGYDLKIKMLPPAQMRAIGEYWLRYGYAVSTFTVPPASLKVMSKFTYWKLRETYITTGNIPETFKQTIRGIMEKGVTVWGTPSDIGNVDMASNIPLTGITL